MEEKKIKRGQIYYVDLAGARGREIYKDRPCVVVSTERINSAGIVTVCPLSTCEQFAKPEHVSIRATTRPNTALCEHLRAVDVGRLGKPLGMCSAKELQMLNAGIAVTLVLEQVDMVAMQEAARAEAHAELASGSTGEVDTIEFIRVRSERDLYKRLYDDLVGRLGGAIATVDVPLDTPQPEPEPEPKPEPEKPKRDMTVFGARCREILEERGMMQMTLAQMIGMPANTLSAYMRHQQPPMDKAVKIARALGVSLDYLLGLSDKR